MGDDYTSSTDLVEYVGDDYGMRVNIWETTTESRK
jgi:hypothetical protein